MKALTRIIFMDDSGQKFFGEGPYRLLRGVGRTGSLRASAMEMGMAYTKALKILKNAEAALGFPLTMRTTGGKDGGGSMLTPEGEEWLKRYESYRDACVQANSSLYMEFFPEQR
ncbi:MAG: LysR family transcriptional regulator [Clostridiales bacterium]|nr:LysR family transcriptional regulator [Clostridiales bacterium]